MSADSDPNPADSAGDDCEKKGEKEREEGEQGDKEREEDREEKENGEEKENEGGKKSEEEEEESKKQKEEEEKDLFRLVVVNSYGSQEVQRLKDDDSIPLKLGSEWMCVLREEGEGVLRAEGERVWDWREVDCSFYICSVVVSSDQTYIACEWQTDVKDECFDVQKATVRNLTLRD